jgi:hypothetical protein
LESAEAADRDEAVHPELVQRLGKLMRYAPQHWNRKKGKKK